MKQQTLWTEALTRIRKGSSTAWSIFKYEFIELNWYRWYAVKSYVMSALWIVPLVAVVIEQGLVRLSAAVGDWLVASGTMSPATVLVASATAGARSILETIISATLSFLVFTFGSLLVAIQVAGGQYTPRVIATIFLRDNVVRSCVGLFVVTLLFAVRTLRQTDDTVHQLNVFLAACFGLLSIVAFLYLIDYAARMLRPVSIVVRVGESGLAVINSVYPEQNSHPGTREPSRKLPP